MEKHRIVIIGGGPAGLAAAVSAYDAGVTDILILERDRELGGILNQCVHNGFGLHTFKEELTGPEYAERYIEMVHERNIPFRTDAMVVDITPEKIITVISPEGGCLNIEADAIVLSMGCRERPRGALAIPGTRPAGIYTAGCAQRLVNLEGYMPGKEIVILGSGDIGLIMARRLTLEGAHVISVLEKMPKSGGLQRNIVQCLEDYSIPLELSTTVTKIEGKQRVEGVWSSKVDADGTPIPGTEQYIPCDTLLLSVGLIPENELSRAIGLDIRPDTKGPETSNTFETKCPGVFACGNVLRVYDLVDNVSKDSAIAGGAAAEYVKKKYRGHSIPDSV